MDNKEQKEENVKKQKEVENNKKDTVNMKEDANKKDENEKEYYGVLHYNYFSILTFFENIK